MSDMLAYVIDPTTQSKETDLDKPVFYTDAETLKQASGYYTFMNYLPANPKLWVENCHPCQLPMKQIMLDNSTQVEVIAGSAIGMPEDKRHWTPQYKAYIQNPETVRINPTSIFWFCANCRSVWVTAIGCWMRVRINGEENLSPGRIKLTEEMLKGVQSMVADALPDPGVKSSDDSTKCPHCHLWRDVRPWEPTPGEVSGKNIHICSKCGTGDIFDVGGGN